MELFFAFANQQIDSACRDSDKLEATIVNVIVFASRKGGSGKSTLAAHLAAHAHRTSKPCLLIDADPQGSLTLWQSLRGTGEPPIKTAAPSVIGIIAAAKRDGYEWEVIDTPPTTSPV